MKFIKNAVVNLVKATSYIIPKSKKLWLFGAWTGKLYADNTKYLFEYVNKNHPEIRAVWLTKEDSVVEQVRALGYECYKWSSVKGAWLTLRAGVAFETEGDNDISRFLNIKRTKVVQLWHGMGIKAVGVTSGWNSSLSQKQIKKSEKAFREKNATWYWFCASEEAKKKYSEAFFVPEKQFIITGQPKDDILAVEKENAYITALRNDHPKAKIAVYLPTHRNFGRQTDINDVMSIESLEKVNRMLEEKNIVMIFKPHFHEFEKYAGYEGTLGNIIFATDKEKFGDVYEFLPACDMMITDYSGIMFGYLASGKPIVYFPYDYDEYVNGDAGFCYDYYDITYGPICKTWEDVVNALATITPEDYAELREKQRARFCPHADGKNCERVYQAVLDIMKK